MQPYHILINRQSGSASVAGQDAIESALKKSKLKVESFHCIEADAFNEKLYELSNSNNPVLIGGGDGTICRAGEMYLENKKSFGILPFGTMNMMARDLNIPTDLSKIFSAYEHTKTTLIDVGMVNGRPFLCCAALGVMPKASRLREETRDQPGFISMPRLGFFVFNELDKTRQRKVLLDIDGGKKRIKTSALVVSNNRYAFSGPAISENSFQRESLHGGRLGIYMASPASMWEKIRLLASLQFSSWKNDPALREYSGQKAVIKTGHKKELISLDGEPLEMEMPLNFQIQSKALKVIVPDGGVNG